MKVRCSRCDGWGRPAGGGRCVCDGTGTTSARTVYRIEASAGARRLDAYVIPPEQPSRAPPSPGARYARLDHHPEDPVVIGIDLSGTEDLTAAWVNAANPAMFDHERAVRRGMWPLG